MTERIKCVRCDNMILEQTAQDNDGLCAPCAKGKALPYESQSGDSADQLDDVDKRNQLLGAIERNDKQRIDELFAHGNAFVLEPPNEFDTWFGEAVSSGCTIEILEKLLSEGCDTNARARSPDETTPLEMAVSEGRMDAVEWLLKNGADPNVGRPIVGAVHWDHSVDSQKQMLNALLDAGADINRSFATHGREEDRFTVLDWATSDDVLVFLKSRGAKHFQDANPQGMVGEQPLETMRDKVTATATLDLEPFRKKLKQEMVDGIQGYDGDGPITRVDVWYDLVSMDVPMVRLYLDNHPTGEPSSGSSDEIELMELDLPEWADACHADNAIIKYSGSTVETDNEESLCEAVGLLLLEIILSIRDDGTLAALPRGDKCYIGVSTYDGVWGWPAWKDRGKDDLV